MQRSAFWGVGINGRKPVPLVLIKPRGRMIFVSHLVCVCLRFVAAPAVIAPGGGGAFCDGGISAAASL